MKVRKNRSIKEVLLGQNQEQLSHYRLGHRAGQYLEISLYRRRERRRRLRAGVSGLHCAGRYSGHDGRNIDRSPWPAKPHQHAAHTGRGRGRQSPLATATATSGISFHINRNNARLKCPSV